MSQQLTELYEVKEEIQSCVRQTWHTHFISVEQKWRDTYGFYFGAEWRARRDHGSQHVSCNTKNRSFLEGSILWLITHIPTVGGYFHAFWTNFQTRVFGGLSVFVMKFYVEEWKEKAGALQLCKSRENQSTALDTSSQGSVWTAPTQNKFGRNTGTTPPEQCTWLWHFSCKSQNRNLRSQQDTPTGSNSSCASLTPQVIEQKCSTKPMCGIDTCGQVTAWILLRNSLRLWTKNVDVTFGKH